MDAQTFSASFAPHLRSGNAAVLCGAGISVPSRLPDWAGLLEDARNELNLGPSFENLSLIATYYVSTVDGGRGKLTKMIKAKLGDTKYYPNDIHRALWELPVPYLWSLNFDNLLEEAHQQLRGRPPRVIETDSKMKGSLAQGGRALVKIHGGLDQLDESGGRDLVITRDDFDAYLRNYPRTWARLLADFYTKSMLFVGISFADPNMQTLLRLVRQADNQITQQHYAVMAAPGAAASPEAIALHRLQVADLRRGGVETVEIDTYDRLPTLLKETAVLARPPVVMIAGSLPASNTSALPFLRALGTLLASSDSEVSIVHGGSETIEALPATFAEHLELIGSYRAERLLQVRRCEPIPGDTVTERRLGSITFPGTDRAAVREDLCSRAAVCVVVGGRSHTAEEVEECRSQGLRIIPVPVGPPPAGEDPLLSQTLWEEIANKPDKDSLECAIAKLDLADPFAKADRVRAIIIQHLFGGSGA